MKEEKIGITILTIVFLALVISLFFLVEPGYTGKAVGQCNDNDNGQDVYISGVTSDSNSFWEDQCSGDKQVVEGYCSSGGVNTAVLPCPAGYSCIAGACRYGIISFTNHTTTSTVDTSTSSSSSSTSSSSTSTVVTSSSTTTSIGNGTSSTTTSIGNGTSSTSTSSSSTTAASSSTTSSSSSSTSTTSADLAQAICAPDWQCGDWSECVNGVQERTCQDIENCGFEDKTEKQKCTAEPEEEAEVEFTIELKEFNLDFSKLETKQFAELQASILTVSFDGKTEHTVELKEVTEDSVTLIITSTPQTITLKVGETKNIDVNEDGETDFSVTLNEITDGKAGLDFKKLNGAEEVAKQEGGIAGPTGLAVADGPNIGGIAAAVIWSAVILGGGLYGLNKYKPLWWLKTRHGTGVAWENTRDATKSGFIRMKFGIKNMFGRRGM